MSEYWVSQAKHYCKICNVWIADNKPSRMHHENGVKHKQKVEEQLKQKRMDKLHGARSESDLKKQLADIERAAKEAIATDRAEQDGNFYQNAGVRGRAPPPPPAPRPPGFPKPAYPGEGGDDLEQEEDDGTGVYTVKGQTYLQGKVHEDKIRTGIACEVFVEALDEWFPGTVSARVETQVPHTDIVLVSFDVEYALQQTSGEQVSLVSEKGIKSDRIRLYADAAGEVQGLEGVAEASAAALRVAVNENTGMGMWQTVSVQQVDEEEEWRRQQEAERQREEMLAHGSRRQDDYEDDGLTPGGGSSNSNRGGAVRPRGAGEELGEDSALSAYDPYGRQKSVYRGIRLHEDVDRKAQIESVAGGALVGFKKRKTASGAVAASSSAGSVKTETTEAGTAVAGASAVGTAVEAPVVQTEAKDTARDGPGHDGGEGLGTRRRGAEEVAATDHSSAAVASAEGPNQPEQLLSASSDPPVAVGKVSMSLGGGGVKRKFRVRAPSP